MVQVTVWREDGVMVAYQRGFDNDFTAEVVAAVLGLRDGVFFYSCNYHGAPLVRMVVKEEVVKTKVVKITEPEYWEEEEDE